MVSERMRAGCSAESEFEPGGEGSVVMIRCEALGFGVGWLLLESKFERRRPVVAKGWHRSLRRSSGGRNAITQINHVAGSPQPHVVLVAETASAGGSFAVGHRTDGRHVRRLPAPLGPYKKRVVPFEVQASPAVLVRAKTHR